jgi:hypothetical protein
MKLEYSSDDEITQPFKKRKTIITMILINNQLPISSRVQIKLNSLLFR